MKLFIHGTDLASKENLSCVEQEALKRGHEVGTERGYSFNRSFFRTR